MSSAVAQLTARDLETLWSRDEPDLQLDQDGRIRPIKTERPAGRSSVFGSAGPAAVGAIASAVPAAAGLVLSELSRWD